MLKKIIIEFTELYMADILMEYWQPESNTQIISQHGIIYAYTHFA